MSPFITDDKIEEVRQRTSIVDVVSGYVTLKRSGKNHVGLCPFHSEKTPSFTVNEEKGIFCCFGCGTGGNVFSFLMRIEGGTFPEVIRDLAERGGIDLPEKGKTSAYKHDKDEEDLFALHSEAAKLYNSLLIKSLEGEAARSYLKSRGIDSKIAKEWQLGFGGRGWTTLSDRLKKKSSLNAAEKAGLVLQGKKGRNYDRFRERLIFPICDLRGRVIAFGGRILDGEGPKYVNSPESPIYTKGNALYGLNITKDAIRGEGEAVVVEGYTDLLSLFRSGIRNVVATLGTALTQNQASLLRRFCRRVVLLFDSDEAGIKAAMRGIEVFMGSGITPMVCALPEGEDPDSFVNGRGADALRKEIDSALPAVDFILGEKIKAGKLSTPSDKAALIREIVPFLRRIDDRVERALTLSRVAERMGVGDGIVLDAMSEGHKKAGRKKVMTGVVARKRSKEEIAQETILELMIGHGNIRKEVMDKGTLKHFSDSRLRAIGGKIVDLCSEGIGVTHSLLMDSMDEEGLRDRISAISMMGDILEGCSPTEVFDDCERIVREWSLMEGERNMTEMLKDAQRSGNNKDIESLLRKKQEFLLSRKSCKS